MLDSFSELIRNAPNTFGVYRFLDSNRNIIYIGKARNLKNRLKSYTRYNDIPYKTYMAVKSTVFVEWDICKNETDALLLEAEMVKKIQPKYNILLKDDKNFAQIIIDKNHHFPSIKYTRKKQKDKKIKIFGPFPNAKHVKEVIDIIRKTTMIRNCADGDFASRKRPCIEYQIGRCTAPCVGLVSKTEYAKQIDDATMILKGKINFVHSELVQRMRDYSIKENFEKAKEMQSKIESLTYIINTLKQNKKTDNALVEYLLSIENDVRESANKLEDIEGLGLKRKALLLNHFGSIDKLKNASLSEIALVKGISKKLANKVFSFFHV